MRLVQLIMIAVAATLGSLVTQYFLFPLIFGPR